MNILLTNDDGYKSDGLMKLAKKLSEKHKVFIVAPDSNRSAVSHHYSMFNQSTIKKYEGNLWTCSGYPADCVFTGLAGALFPEKIDVVISGINYGPNMGTDIVYSGTCAAARQATLQNYPAIALSIDPVSWEKAGKEGFKFDALIDFVDKNLEKLISLVKKDVPRAFVNVNGASLDSYKGALLLDDICQRKYDDHLQLEAADSVDVAENSKTADIKELETYKTRLVFGNNTTDSVEGQDYKVCRDGYIAVTRIYADPICCPSVDGVTFSL